MRRLLFVILMIFIVIHLSSCASTSNRVKVEQNRELDQVTVYGGSVGGIWSIFTEGISEAVRKEYPGTLISSVPGTVAGNPILVHEEKADFAISESLIATFAFEGTKPFEKEHENIRAVAAIMPINIFQLVAPVSAPFNSIEDVVNNKIGIRYSAGEKDALGDLVSASIFEAYGLTYNDLETFGGEVNFLSGGKTFELMADARIDSLGKMVPIPAGDIMEASATIDMKFISIGEQAIDHLVEKYGMTRFIMEAGSYEFQDEDYPTVNSPTILITNAQMSENAVYQMTKSIYNQLEYLYDVHRSLQEVNHETITEVGKIPLHPGAEKFYQEQGLLK